MSTNALDANSIISQELRSRDPQSGTSALPTSSDTLMMLPSSHSARSSLSHKDLLGQSETTLASVRAGGDEGEGLHPSRSGNSIDERRNDGETLVSTSITPARPERKSVSKTASSAGAQALQQERVSSQSNKAFSSGPGGLEVNLPTVVHPLASPLTKMQVLPNATDVFETRDVPESTPHAVKEPNGEAIATLSQADPVAQSKEVMDSAMDKVNNGQPPSKPKQTSGGIDISKSQVTSEQPVSQANPARATRLTGSRAIPQLPNAKNVSGAPPPAMYWSKAPVHGNIPRRSFRAHTASLADEVLWLFGGCDAKGCFHDLYCFDTETMCWSKPKVTGDVPPARRAHSATMVDKRLFVFAGGDGPYYFNDLYVFDTIALRWTKPDVYGQAPSPRRAHTSSYYDGQLIIFGGGNGVGALNDVFSLDITDLNRLEWRKIECRGKVPIGRGYHTSNLVDGKLIVIGGSDGHTSFDDIQILRLDTKVWYEVKTDEIHNRLGHTATQVGSYLFIIGGHDSRSYTPDVLTLNLVNLQWEPRNVCGKKPPGRGYHQSWLRDGRLFVHGGFDGKEIYDDLYYIDLSACAYLPQITSFNVELDDD